MEGMLASVQRFEVAELGVRRVVHAAYHPRLWIFVAQQSDAVMDERLGRLAVRRPTVGRAYVGFLLGGDTRVRSVAGDERWFAPGAALAADARGQLGMRTEGTREPLLSISIEWDKDFYGTRATGGARTGCLASIAATREQVDALLLAIEEAWSDAGGEVRLAAAAASLLGMLRADGFDLPTVEPADLVHDVGAVERSLSHALDTVLALRDSRPMMTDVESLLGLSRRTVERHLPAVLTLWGQLPETFRDLRGRHRLFQAALAMSHPAATTERTARICGFATANALCRSFLHAGLPSPGRIRQRLHELQ
jgi:AraC-like DNA-binding protein